MTDTPRPTGHYWVDLGTGPEPARWDAEGEVSLPVAYRQWQVETFDRMRDALWRITSAQTLEGAHNLARKALDK